MIKYFQCNHKELRCPNREKQRGINHGRCLLKNPLDCPFEPKNLKDFGDAETITQLEKTDLEVNNG